ncbi:MAG: hypothetical protein B7X08_03220 [Acidocella sp. 20-63-7]|nr:MAG: hypothetical protein B7X08_03220 [Acidocella sp. 20-63-7]
MVAKPERVVATEAALALIAHLTAEHGKVMGNINLSESGPGQHFLPRQHMCDKEALETSS